MRKENLVEFLSSIIEEDAIISRLYNLFHIRYGYEIQELDNLVQHGVKNNNFIIENIDSSDVTYNKVEWSEDNNFQEIVIIENSDFVRQLFSETPEIPKDFVQFLDWFSKHLMKNGIFKIENKEMENIIKKMI